MNTTNSIRYMLLSATVVAGCAGMETRPPASAPASAPADSVKMDAVLIQAESDPLTGLDGYDAQQLLEVGNQRYADEQYAEAVKVYDRLLSIFPESDLVPSAVYNKGLAFEQLAEFESAYEAFAKVVKDYPTAPSHKQAQFRVAFNLGKLERWQGVADAFWAIRQRDDRTPMDELEARVGQGVAMFMLKDYASAEKEFMSALRFHDKESKLQYLPAEYWVGQSRFYLGEINAQAFDEVALPAPAAPDRDWTATMSEALEHKCQLLLRAQNNFIRTIRVGHTGWATAAGYRIGSMYEKLYDALVDLPVPPDLGDDARSVYREEVRDRVSVLVMKAIKVYESSLQMARRVGEKNEWVDKTTEQLERMKTLYLATLDS